MSYTKHTYVNRHLNKSASTKYYGFHVEKTLSHYKNSIAVPSKAPTSFSLTAKSSTSIEASWQLPPEDSRNGIIRGFKLFYKKKGSSGSSAQLPIGKATTTRTTVISELDEYTEYEFQVLAFTAVGDGPNSTAAPARTKEDGK